MNGFIRHQDSSLHRWHPVGGVATWCGSSRAVGSLPGGIVGPLCTSPLKTVHFSAKIPTLTATRSINTRTYCCLIIGMFTQLAAATAAKGTQRATRGGAFYRRRKKRGVSAEVRTSRAANRRLGSTCVTFLYCFKPSSSFKPIDCKS